jgi:hypothetical protein
MAMHGILGLKARRIVGGGAEWFLMTRAALLMIVRGIGGTQSALQPTN